MKEKQPDFEVHINALDIAKALAGVAVDHVTSMLSNLPKTPLSTHGDHFTDRQQAHEMMASPEAQEAYEQLRIEFDSASDLKQPHDWTQYPELDHELGYDDMGNYTTNWDVV